MIGRNRVVVVRETTSLPCGAGDFPTFKFGKVETLAPPNGQQNDNDDEPGVPLHTNIGVNYHTAVDESNGIFCGEQQNEETVGQKGKSQRLDRNRPTTVEAEASGHESHNGHCAVDVDDLDISAEFSFNLGEHGGKGNQHQQNWIDKNRARFGCK